MTQRVVGGHCRGLVGDDDLAEVQDDGTVRDGQARYAAFCSTRTTVMSLRSVWSRRMRHQLRRHHRRETQARLVEQQEPGPRDEGAADDQHLALPTRKGGGVSAAEALQTGKELEDLADCVIARRARRRHHNVASRRFSSTVNSSMTPRPSGTCATPIRAMDSTAAADESVAVEAHGTVLRLHQSRDGAQQRGLAGAVRSEDRSHGTGRRRRMTPSASAWTAP